MVASSAPHVMPALVAGIHDTLQRSKGLPTLPPPKVSMDCRIKPGNDVVGMCVTSSSAKKVLRAFRRP